MKNSTISAFSTAAICSRIPIVGWADRSSRRVSRGVAGRPPIGVVRWPFKAQPLTAKSGGRDQARAVGDESALRNRKFESTPLQQRVHKLSVPVRAGRRIAFTRAYRMQPLAQLPAVCATGLAAAAGWSDRWVIVTGSSNPLLSSRQSAETLSVHEGTLPVASAGSRNRK